MHSFWLHSRFSVIFLGVLITRKKPKWIEKLAAIIIIRRMEFLFSLKISALPAILWTSINRNDWMSDTVPIRYNSSVLLCHTHMEMRKGMLFHCYHFHWMCARACYYMPPKLCHSRELCVWRKEKIPAIFKDSMKTKRVRESNRVLLNFMKGGWSEWQTCFVQTIAQIDPNIIIPVIFRSLFSCKTTRISIMWFKCFKHRNKNVLSLENVHYRCRFCFHFSFCEYSCYIILIDNMQYTNNFQ